MTVAAMTALQGCYNYAPLDSGVAPVGETVEMQISDRGRVELGERLGRGVSKIEGRVTGAEGDIYMLNVFGVSYLSGDHSKWSGEAMRLDRSFVDRVATRHLSRGRTWAAVGVTAVAVGVLIATQGLAGFAFDKRQPDPPPPPTSLLPNVNF